MAYNSIILKDYLNVFEEMVAAAALYPGHLLEPNSVGNVQKHSSAGGSLIPMFATENELQGNGIDDAYSLDDQVFVWIPTRGDQVQAVLKDGESVSTGDFLESAGDGTLQKHTPDASQATIYSDQIVGQALEGLDLSGGGESLSDRRIKLRII